MKRYATNPGLWICFNQRKMSTKDLGKMDIDNLERTL